MKSRKNLIIIALVVLVSVVGLSYAFFNYYQVSQRNLQLITGEIYLRLNEGTEQISLINAFPETAEEARARDDNYITFTITGKNTTTNHDIHYEIDLTEGDPIEGRTRLDATDLRFDLIEMNGEEEIYLAYDESFSDLNDHKVWIDEVLKDTTEEIERTYKLRMWISEDVLISDTDNNASYTTGEYKNSYASVKVSVLGDFNEKYTDAACFETEDVLGNIEVVSYKRNTSEDGINSCKTFFVNIFGSDMSDAKDGYQTFCEGTGTVNNGTIDQFLKEMYATAGGGQFISLLINNNVIVYDKIAYYTHNTDSLAVSVCMDYMLNTYNGGVDKSADQDNYYEFCKGTGYYKMSDSSAGFFDYILQKQQFSETDIEYFLTNGVLIQDDGPIIKGVGITNYDITCGTEVFIPERINNLAVVETSGFEDKEITRLYVPNSVEELGGFRGNNLKSVLIPGSVMLLDASSFQGNELLYVHMEEGVTRLGTSVFSHNQIVEINIPNSVTYILSRAFVNSGLHSIYISNNIKYIGLNAFNGIKNIIVNKSCSDIRNIPANPVDTVSVYPWLSDTSPYIASGSTVYGANDEVCDSY